ncbi:MAG: hypothetical protein JSV64_03955 [Candidatus Bathyarchaeota archaeon]|nr:MAG: hypothetical protein JSV64_03955 [Candidatus Bathyarchaeota archaeon]
MVKREVLYFEDYGAQNTDQTLDAARKAAGSLGLKHAVVATASGLTGVKAAKVFKGSGVKVIVVTEYAGMAKFEEENRKKLESLGADVVTSTHSFLSPAESLSKLHTGYCSENTIIKAVLRRFSQGMKVAAEIVMMASDAGAIPVDEDVVSIAGTGNGADTAVIVKSCHSDDFFHKEKGLEFKEIIAMPRKKKFW